MSFNGRLSSLRPQLQHASRLFPHSQRRALNEFITRHPERNLSPENSAPPKTIMPEEPFLFAAKDNIATLPEDGPTTCASAILSGYESPFEATIVTQMKALGGTLVGKTNMDEFGMGSHSTNSSYGPVAQELADGTKLSAGGSSGGSAVAVATGAADIALGTDTGGSVRLPAAYCGIVGYKPTYGMFSRHGVVPYANSLDTVGFFARDAETLMNKVILRRLPERDDPLDPTCFSRKTRLRATDQMGYYQKRSTAVESDQKAQTLLSRFKFGIPVQYNIAELDPAIRQGWHDVADWLHKTTGARVIPVSLPTTKHALSAYYVIAPAEASSNLAKYDGVRYGPKQAEVESKARGDGDDNGDVLYSTLRGQLFGDEVKRRILLGSYTLSSEARDNYFVQAQRVRQLVCRDFDRVFKPRNPLRDRDAQTFSLADMDEDVKLHDKLGPEEVDILLCPTAPTLPPRLEDVQAGQERNPVDAYVNDVFTVPASLAGVPAVSIPLDVDGPPGGKNQMGLQVIGQCFDDGRVLLVAQCIQRLFKGASRTPEESTES